MLLTITCDHQPAGDFGYLLCKHPERVQAFDLAFGRAHVCYPELTDQRCTVALLLEVDPVRLVRRGRPGESAPLAPYVNDRPYVASSFLSVALGQVFHSALAGRCKERPELAETPLPLTARLPVVPLRGGPELLRNLFVPLGYEVTAERHPLDPAFPDWGGSPHHTVTLTGTVRLSDLLAHLYVLVPVLDDEKHYYVGPDEVEKLLRRGAGWLPAHPERELIARRYLRHQRSLVDAALAQLVAEDAPDLEAAETRQASAEAALEEPLSLNQQRLQAVVATLKDAGAHRVIDLGCGEGRLLRLLLADGSFTEIVGVDASTRVLERAHERLRIDRLAPMQRQRIRLLQGALTYRDTRLHGFDAAAVVEVIEHLDPPRLEAFERVLFEQARPATVVLTTPNAEYNPKWPSLPAGKLRHADHRFEWTRAEFAAWASGVAERRGYRVEFWPIGPEDEEVGAPTQMAVFRR